MKPIMPTFDSLMKSPVNMVVMGSPVAKSPMFVSRKSSASLENKQTRTTSPEEMKSDEIQRDTERNEYPQSLCERILQKVVSLFYSSKHLLVLTLLQSSSKALTIEEISQLTGRSLGHSVIGPCLDDLVSDYMVSRIAISEGTTTSRSTRGKKRMCIYKYYIDYKVAIEVIVYKVSRLEVSNQSSISTPDTMKYFCHCNPTTVYSYYEAMEYFYDGAFCCPECTREMERVEEMQEKKKESSSNGFITLRSLKDELVSLKKEYFDVLDYPKVSFGNEDLHVPETPGLKGLSRNQKAIHKEEKKVKFYSNQRMPWEDSDDEIVETIPMVEDKQLEIEIDFENLPFGDFKFLEPNKTFVDYAETICTSPERPDTQVILVKPNRKGGKSIRNGTRRPIMTCMK